MEVVFLGGVGLVGRWVASLATRLVGPTVALRGGWVGDAFGERWVRLG